MKENMDVMKLEFKPPSLWGSKAELPLFAYMGLGCFLGAFASDQVLTNSPVLTAFTNWMASIVPSIDPMSRISSFPEVVKFYFSVMWFLSPAVVMMYTMTKIIQPWRQGEVPRLHINSTRGYFIFFIGLPLAMLFAYLALNETRFSAKDITYLGGRGRAWLTMMLTNRLGLAVIGSIYVTGINICVYAPVATVLIYSLRIYHYFRPRSEK